MARILVVDDEPAMRDMVLQLLQQQGHGVDTAENGRSALEKITAEKFDAVIVDILMPEKDGIDTMIDIKKSSPSTRIIAMSGGRRSISAGFNLDSAKLLGADGVLEKPFGLNELRNVLGEVL